MARNLTDAFDGFLRAPLRYVLLDRDAKFTAEFQGILTAAEVKPVLLPPQSPNCNDYASSCTGHQGLDHRILEPGPEVGQEVGVIARHERLGGLLKYYHRQAA